jgi:ankyrin repeat protein
MDKLLELVKNKNVKELEKFIKNNKKLDLNETEEGEDHLIFYILLFNYENILDIILTRDIRLDMLDIDGKSVLFNPIKHNYLSVLKKLLSYDSKHIGISILDIKDKYGLTPLFYTIIFNKFDAFKLLLEYEANYLVVNNDNLNCLFLAIQLNKKEFFIYLLNMEKTSSDINFYTYDKQTLLHYAIKEDRFDFIDYILLKKININAQEELAGLTALHMAIIKINITPANIFMYI